ncbi:MAG: hypothetical protein WCT49_02870 [Candidatus Paceibacterota bacterium]|jgi:hypothetical protein|nr:hypothetical protein [Candidatus Paceibacterota bacterium]
MKQNRKVKEFLNELVAMFNVKAEHSGTSNNGENIWRISQKLTEIADSENPNWEKEIDCEIMKQIIWANLRFFVEGRNVIDTNHQMYAWVIYEIVRDC